MTQREAITQQPWMRAIIDAKAGAELTLKRPGERYGTRIAPSDIARDVLTLADEANHWKAEALKWQALAQKLMHA